LPRGATGALEERLDYRIVHVPSQSFISRPFALHQPLTPSFTFPFPTHRIAGRAAAQLVDQITMRFSFSLFAALATLGGALASNVLELTPDNWDTHIGKGSPAMVELCVLLLAILIPCDGV
jgi:hypothetical protein